MEAFFFGAAIGLSTGAIGVLVTNYTWYRLATKQNHEWSWLSQQQSEQLLKVANEVSK